MVLSSFEKALMLRIIKIKNAKIKTKNPEKILTILPPNLITETIINTNNAAIPKNSNKHKTIVKTLPEFLALMVMVG